MNESTWLFGEETLGSEAKSHTSIPVGFHIDDVIRVFVSSRDVDGCSLPYFVDLDRQTLQVRGTSDGPLLALGRLGTFDEHGVMPSSVVRDLDGRIRMHYVGWNRSVGSVPYRVSIGCAISDDGATFERLTDGPALDRNPHDPIFVTTPHVTIDDGWSMLYSTADRWVVLGGHPEPFYHLARARSVDGVHWEPCDTISLPLDADAVTRPTTMSVDGRTLLGFCHRRADGYRTEAGAAYRIGVAWLDGNDATVLDSDLQFDDSTWAGLMRCYPSFLNVDGRLLMLYNGDGFGRSGVGGAWLELDDLGLGR